MKTSTQSHAPSALKYFIVILIQSIILGKPIQAQSGASLTLVLNGAPNNCAIVLAVNATNAAKLAAYELQHYIWKISGAELNIATDGIGAGYENRILVGESQATRAYGYGYFSSDFAFNEYLIEVRISSDHNDLILMGLDDTTVDLNFGKNHYDGDFCGPEYDNWWMAVDADGCPDYPGNKNLPEHPNYHLQEFIDQAAAGAEMADTQRIDRV